MSSLTEDEVTLLRSYATRGFVYLNVNVHGFRKCIDVDSLNVACADCSVLAQVFGGTHEEGLTEVGRTKEWAVAHGFEPPMSAEVPERYAEAVNVLNEAWRELLAN